MWKTLKEIAQIFIKEGASGVLRPTGNSLEFLLYWMQKGQQKINVSFFVRKYSFSFDIFFTNLGYSFMNCLIWICYLINTDVLSEKKICSTLESFKNFNCFINFETLFIFKHVSVCFVLFIDFLFLIGKTFFVIDLFSATILQLIRKATKNKQKISCKCNGECLKVSTN